MSFCPCIIQHISVLKRTFFHGHIAIIACNRINSNSWLSALHFRISLIVSEVTIVGLFKSGFKVCMLHLVVSPLMPTLIWGTPLLPTPAFKLLLPSVLSPTLDSEHFDAGVRFCALWDHQCHVWDRAEAR